MDWLSAESDKSTEYPYEEPFPMDLYEDPYNRDYIRLMESISIFSRMAVNGEITLDLPPDSLQPLYNFCRNQISNTDLNYLIRMFPPRNVPYGDFPPDKIPSRHIYPIDILFWTPREAVIALANATSYDTAIFCHGTSQVDWIILVVFPKESPIRFEVFVIGNVEKEIIHVTAKTLEKYLKVISPSKSMHFSFRKTFPFTPDVDNGSQVFVLLHYLYHHGNYLDVDTTVIRRYKLNVLSTSHDKRNVILLHDFYLGHL